MVADYSPPEAIEAKAALATLSPLTTRIRARLDRISHDDTTIKVRCDAHTVFL